MGARDVTTKVAVLASSPDQRQYFQDALKQYGINIVMNEAASDHFLQTLSTSGANVLLINASDDDSEADDALIDTISAETEIPILFHDSSPNANAAAGDVWLRKLVDKLNDTADSAGKPAEPTWNQSPHPQVAPKASNFEPESVEFEAPMLSMDSSEFDFSEVELESATDYNVWVLGASLGGPQAVRQFLAAIEPDLPVTFILAQHIGANHVTLLAEQLDRVTKFKVLPGRTGHKMSHQEVILTPADKHLTFTDDGFLALQPTPPATIYSPSIDNVMAEVAKIFGSRSGTIIFSGMGDDGALGCQSIANKGGIVWAQDIASCVVSSMPDHARKTGTVSYSAKPEELARHLYQHFQ